MLWSRSREANLLLPAVLEVAPVGGESPSSRRASGRQDNRFFRIFPLGKLTKTYNLGIVLGGTAALWWLSSPGSRTFFAAINPGRSAGQKAGGLARMQGALTTPDLRRSRRRANPTRPRPIRLPSRG